MQKSLFLRRTIDNVRKIKWKKKCVEEECRCKGFNQLKSFLGTENQKGLHWSDSSDSPRNDQICAWILIWKCLESNLYLIFYKLYWGKLLYFFLITLLLRVCAPSQPTPGQTSFSLLNCYSSVLFFFEFILFYFLFIVPFNLPGTVPPPSTPLNHPHLTPTPPTSIHVSINSPTAASYLVTNSELKTWISWRSHHFSDHRPWPVFGNVEFGIFKLTLFCMFFFLIVLLQIVIYSFLLLNM